MKLGSQEVVNITSKALGLSEAQALDAKKCIGFKSGRAMLMGPWASTGDEAEPSSRSFYVAARRTREGGRDLSDGWLDPDWQKKFHIEIVLEDE
jgi:hypothetical protein